MDDEKVISNDHAPLNGERGFLPRDKATEVIVEDEAAAMAGRTDDGYKHRLLHTLCVCSTMFALGWRNGLVGPTFPDLRLIINEDLAKASWIFTAISFGGLLGSVIGGFAYDRVSKIPLFVIVTCGLGIVGGATPYCNQFVSSFTAHVLHGAFASAIDTVATSDIVVVWRGKANSYMQTIHGIFSVGAILSPFAAESFLARKIYLPQPTAHERAHAYNIISQEYSNNLTNVSLNMSVSSSDQNEDDFIYGETRIYIPYFISTAISFLAAILYIIVYVSYGSVYTKSIRMNEELMVGKKKEYFLTKKWKVVLTVLLAITLTLYVMAERGFTNFLMTFLITRLNWSKTEGSKASALFWITFALGRLSGIGIVRVLRLSYMILAFFTFLTGGGILLWAAVVYNQKVLVLVAIAVIGYGMSTTFASIFSWLSENVRTLTGKIASILFVFFSTGAMLFPILVGYLMENVSQMWFIYTQLFAFFIMVICFIFILMLFRFLEKVKCTSSGAPFIK